MRKEALIFLNGNSAFKSGFVAIAGRPNVGKSTFLNAVIGEKAAIVSNKPQTTRNKIRAILTAEDSQIIFIDTPGMHKPRDRLGDLMVRSVRSALGEVDVVLLITDALFDPGRGDRFVADCLKGLKTPTFLVLNKIDAVSAKMSGKRLAMYQELYLFAASFMVSARQKAGIAAVVEHLKLYLPPGPCYYPPETVIDRPEYFLVSEFIREKILHLTREEMPFSVAVAVEEMRKRKNREIVDIRAVIYVERDSQKGIIVGKGGAMLKEIGTRARADIENMLGSQVFLDLFVKVSPDWRNRNTALNELGYREN